jgi:HNH endonuclease
MATKRKTLSKKTRFEVFKRDSFKCQYCGASSPEAVLVVDHIDPISKDGADEMFNYITSCQPCNAGKSDRKLDDQSTLARQKAQLDELNARREQLEMLMNWRSGIKDIKETQADVLCEAWKSAAPGYVLNETGKKTLRGYMRKFSMEQILDAFEVVGDKYVKTGVDGVTDAASVNLAWSKVGGVLHMASMPEGQKELHYIKGILRNRLNYIPYDVLKFLQYAMEDGVDLGAMKLEAKHASTWTRFSEWLVEAREEARGEG